LSLTSPYPLGMPPWSGIPEDEVRRRVCEGEKLPYLTGTPPSLVMYLTQYGLKWNAHERDLDLHEIHTMLKSLRVSVVTGDTSSARNHEAD